MLAVALAALAGAVMPLSSAVGASASARPSPFFGAAMSFIYASNGRSYALSDSLDLPRGAMSPTSPVKIVDAPRCCNATNAVVEMRVLGGASQTVAGPQHVTARPVFGPRGAVAWADRSIVHYRGGRTLRPRGLPPDPTIVAIELSPIPGVLAATVQWGGGYKIEPHEAIYVITNSRAVLVAGQFRAWCNVPDPVWSPNGARLAFERQVNCSDGVIESVCKDGSGSIRVSKTSKATGPYWSPDSRRVAFTARHGWKPHESNGVPEVYVADLHGHEERLTSTTPVHGPAHSVGDYVPPGSHAGAWSPDGRAIAVVTGTAFGVVSAKGGHERITATFSRSAGRGPIWWPASR
jgi:WD40-like Beta Propeller Repeat